MWQIEPEGLLMTLLGEDLTALKLAAIALAIYAICYGTLSVFVAGAAFASPIAAFALLGLLALATTPFFAIMHLNRLTNKGTGPPARPAIMAIVMTVPAAFWLYASATSVTPLYYTQFADVVLIAGLVLVPGLLALWLAVTFVLLALQGRTKVAAINPTNAADIE